MKREIVTGLLCGLVIAGCSGPHPHKVLSSDSTRAAADSVQAAASAAQPRAEQSLAVLSYEERQGSVLFAKYCAVCHGQEGKGDGFNAFNLDPRPRDLSDSVAMKSLSDDQIFRTIAGGGRSVNKSPLMPAYGWTLNPRQIQYIAAYIRTFSRPL